MPAQTAAGAARRLGILLALLATCVAAVSCERSPPPELGKLDGDARILAFGDSLTFGTGGRGRSYPQILSEIIGIEVVSAGVPGERSGAALRRLPRTLESVRPDLVILCIGGNDILRKVPDETLEANLREMADMVAESGAALVLVSVPRFSLIPWNHPAYLEVAEEKDLWLEDEILKRVLHDNGLKSDQVHPNAEGYGEIAAAMADLLRRAGAI